ncbi:MAG: DUF4157 domain-containing protein [bacterium]|nr:DUF4157 domain-containing protein [bacterium]
MNKDVRVHTGHDIVFAARNFDPATQKGKKLLGHELTHVLQQKGGAVKRKKKTLDRSMVEPVIQRTSAATGAL